jgi:hypothetical protein
VAFNDVLNKNDMRLDWGMGGALGGDYQQRGDEGAITMAAKVAFEN